MSLVEVENLSVLSNLAFKVAIYSYIQRPACTCTLMLNELKSIYTAQFRHCIRVVISSINVVKLPLDKAMDEGIRLKDLQQNGQRNMSIASCFTRCQLFMYS